MNEKDYDKKEYLKTLKERAKTSRVYKKHQMTGLMISQMLNDNEHKSLYIKLAKEKDQDALISLAKDVSERNGIENKGAYFMAMLSKDKKEIKSERKKKWPKSGK
jgi:hypothetical protein